MTPTPSLIVALLALVLFTIAAWDVARRILAQRASDAARGVDLLGSLVERYEAAAARDKAALESFLAQILEVTRFTERSRREAEGAALTGRAASRSGLERSR